MCSRILAVLGRRKQMEDDTETSQLARCLNVIDLTALGVGSTLGLGAYVLAGAVAKNTAGPAVVLSFLVAAVASAFAALCYAEFAARVPKAGSAYVYSYVTVGEFVAFIIGWNLILEYVIGTASVARGMSSYVDALTNFTMKEFFIAHSPGWDYDFLSEYFDYFSLVVIIFLTILLSVGVKESTFVNNIFTAFNLLTIGTVIVAGLFHLDFDNWKIAKDAIPEEYKETAGEGGFFPFGFTGVMAGAATCFYGFVGFDCVATTGEEAKNPQKSIPLAILFSLIIIFLAYFGISGVLTLMWPYYDQDANAPFPYVFEMIGWTSIKWLVTIGAVVALSTSLLGALFPLPRVFYAMASDRILFSGLASINKSTKTPLVATIVSGVLSAAMALLFNLSQLIDMMSIGTLLAYTIVAVCVLILRFEDANQEDRPVDKNSMLGHLFNTPVKDVPNRLTSSICSWATVIYSLLVVGFCYMVVNHAKDIVNKETTPMVLTGVCVGAMILVLIAINSQPRTSISLSFKVPFVPLVPAISVIFNIYLMMQLDINTWIRFAVWMGIGFVIYIFYSIPNSLAGKSTSESFNLTAAAYTNDAYAEEKPKAEVVSKC